MSTEPAPPIPAPFDAGLAAASLQGLWKERSALLIESTGEGLFGVDMQGRCIFVNRAGAQMLGYRAEEVLQRNMHELIHHSHPDGRPYPEAECPIFAAFREGRPCRIDDEVLWRKDGSSFAAEYSSHPIVEATPEGPVTIGAVASFVDISRRKQTELLLKRMNAQLTQSNEELERRVAARTAELSGALAQLRELAAYSESVRETERTRIAREIHDELGSLLVALKMDVGWLGKRLDGRTDLQCKCHGMGSTIDRAVGNLGRIITDLRPSILDHQGLWAALEWQAQEFVEASELRADVQFHVATGVEPPSAAHGGEGGERWAIAVFRIFQEMLSNVARHAQARSVWIRLYVEGPPRGVLHLEVRDDGIGAAREALMHPKSYGVLGMRERAAHFGGRITIETAPQQGTVVRLVMPLPEGGADGGSAITAARVAALARAASMAPAAAGRGGVA
ncbi:MAG TPA: PAS domain S-box protein [Methylibium sp.]|uniref:PAS domain-containing sensor histidine kinase n=1 Tax=Methylibium sp. TaxID=2067992 RepID=UPI002DBE5795|nr:PAS domain S-box protein [Methylibium sp.]HEU4458964.1 PAS domain S-box protein [Methylibium sp.]